MKIKIYWANIITNYLISLCAVAILMCMGFSPDIAYIISMLVVFLSPLPVIEVKK